MGYRHAPALVLLLAAGCAYLPSAAPTAREFAADRAVGTLLVDLDPAVAQVIGQERAPGLAALLPLAGYRPSLALRPGDTVAITVFDLSPVALLGASDAAPSASTPNQPISSHMAALPAQTVELDGTVVIPFAGPVRLGGLTPEQAAARIAQALAGSATNPQVVVSLENSVLNTATVGGEVARPAIVPLTLRAERVLDVIAAAGGARFPLYDCDVQLVRAGRVARSNLQRLLDQPEEDVTVQPGDGVFVIHNPRSFSVLGAALKVSQFDFNAEQVNLAEAIARAGGPEEQTADVGQLYLLRAASPEMLAQIAASQGWPANDPRRSAAGELATGHWPQATDVALHLDLRHGGGYFLARSIQIRDKDVILVTNADADQLQKLLGALHGFTGVYYDLKRTGP